MIARILMNPTAEAGGTAAVPPVVEAKAEPGKAPEVKVVAKAEEPPAGTVVVKAEELAGINSRLKAYEDAEKAKAAKEREDAEKAAREKGDLESIVKSRDKDVAEARTAVTSTQAELAKSRDDYKALERETAASFIDRDLAVALPGSDLVPGAAAQLVKLWGDDFQAKRADGRWVVTSKDGRPVADVVKERLASPEYIHFLANKSRPGAGSGGSAAAPTNPTAGAGQTLGDRMIEQATQRGAAVSPFLAKYKSN